MTPRKAFLRSSLALWRRRHDYRQARLDIAHEANDQARIDHWHKLLVEAGAMIAKREQQLAGPLRLRAFAEILKLERAGVHEVGGNNRGAEVEAIIKANGGVPGEPWCGDTVAYCYLKAGAKSVVRSWAAVRYLEKLLTRVRRPRRGHVVTYTFSHTGLFDRWRRDVGPGYFDAIEGNTGTGGASSDGTSDGVHIRLRNTSLVSGFWRVLR